MHHHETCMIQALTQFASGNPRRQDNHRRSTGYPQVTTKLQTMTVAITVGQIVGWFTKLNGRRVAICRDAECERLVDELIEPIRAEGAHAVVCTLCRRRFT